MSELLDTLLSKPVGEAISTPVVPTQCTRQLEVSGSSATITVKGASAEENEKAAAETLEAQGLSPDEWRATGFRTSEWTMANGETGLSTRFSYARTSKPNEGSGVPVGELIASIDRRPAPEPFAGPLGDHTYIVALGDMQFGKIDGDGVEGTVRRTIECLDKARANLEAYRLRYAISHVHITWLGDHVEGFVSQGGSNTWRTVLTLNEQIRLTRRVMLHALLLFEDAAPKITMAAVPGNHGEAVRVMGKGMTRYDDSHDTESLVAVKDACDLSPERFAHVQFFVPDTDELTVIVDCSGTLVAQAHGHQWTKGKHFEWWRKQSFGGSELANCHLLLCGHLHHLFIEMNGHRTFVQVPALESESTWWKTKTGEIGYPGIVVMVTSGGKIHSQELIAGEVL